MDAKHYDENNEWCGPSMLERHRSSTTGWNFRVTAHRHTRPQQQTTAPASRMDSAAHRMGLAEFRGD